MSLSPNAEKFIVARDGYDAINVHPTPFVVIFKPFVRVSAREPNALVSVDVRLMPAASS